MRRRYSLVFQAALWLLIIVLAFVMQVIPLLLILTMFNLAMGVSSGAVLIAVPVALLGSLLLAFVLAERRRRKWRPSPVRVDEARHQQMTRNKAAMRAGSLPARAHRRGWFF